MMTHGAPHDAIWTKRFLFSRKKEIFQELIQEVDLKQEILSLIYSNHRKIVLKELGNILLLIFYLHRKEMGMWLVPVKKHMFS